MDALSAQFAELRPPELVAVIFAIAYLLLAIRQNIWCWLCAGISTGLYVYLSADARLYMASALNVFYFAMAGYGWFAWRAGAGGAVELPVTVWPWRRHAVALATIGGLSALSGTLLHGFSDAAWPYVDSLTAFAAIWATFLVARKVLENWWYWLLIDAASVFIYWSRDLELTALLYVFYLGLIPIGLLSWTRSLRRQAAT